jgi:hypothetical protein
MTVPRCPCVRAFADTATHTPRLPCLGPLASLVRSVDSCAVREPMSSRACARSRRWDLEAQRLVGLLGAEQPAPVLREPARAVGARAPAPAWTGAPHLHRPLQSHGLHLPHTRRAVRLRTRSRAASAKTTVRARFATARACTEMASPSEPSGSAHTATTGAAGSRRTPGVSAPPAAPSSGRPTGWRKAAGSRSGDEDSAPGAAGGGVSGTWRTVWRGRSTTERKEPRCCEGRTCGRARGR